MAANDNSSLFGFEDDLSESAARIIVFHPFNRTLCFPPVQTNKGTVIQPSPTGSWNKGHQSIYADDKIAVRRAKFQSLTSQKDTLYIFGQCTAGSRLLFPIRASISPDKVHAEALAKMLQDGDLPDFFSGRIKIYACHSATPSSTDDSFAKVFAREIRALGYESCKIIGYSAQVSTFALDKAGGKTGPELSNEEREKATFHKFVVDGPKKGQRAKSAQVLIENEFVF